MDGRDREYVEAIYQGVLACGRPLAVPEADALDAVEWVARHHPDLDEAVRVAISLVCTA
jgi:hypothetical protein